MYKSLLRGKDHFNLVQANTKTPLIVCEVPKHLLTINSSATEIWNSASILIIILCNLKKESKQHQCYNYILFLVGGNIVA